MENEKIDAVAQACTLSTLAPKAADKFILGEKYAIVDAVADFREKGMDGTDIDIGIGTISMTFDEGKLKWKFIPSKELESWCIDSLVHRKNLLPESLGRALATKLTLLYKELI